jgi:hypothetical protein
MGEVVVSGEVDNAAVIAAIEGAGFTATAAN